jgi:hypothetical protein
LGVVAAATVNANSLKDRNDLIVTLQERACRRVAFAPKARRI